MHYTAVDVVRAHGRPVCSTDFGHFSVIDTAIIVLTFDHSYRWVPLHLAGAVAILERLDKDGT